MSEQVNTTTSENTKQDAVDIGKTADQQNATATTETAKAAAVVQDAKVDSATGGTTEPPKADAKVVPEKYDLKLADGSLLDPASIEMIATFAKEQGLSNEAAQAILDREHEAITSFNTTQENQFNERKSQWVETLKADKELGGDNFKKTAILSNRVIEQHASPEFKQLLASSGLGNHPELVRVFSRVAKELGYADSFVTGGGNPSDQKSLSDRLYDKTAKQGANQ